MAQHRIIALTRSKDSAAAQHLAVLPGIEVLEQLWTKIDSDWLREHDVARIFLASHNEPLQFMEEGQFMVEALRAQVKYLVRISTTAANVRPDFSIYYLRTH